jgi:plasmid stabilization system protein ParE
MANSEYHVRLADPAKTDLADIDDYISNELKSPQAAENLIASLQITLTKLSYSPHSYLKVRDDHLAARGYHWAESRITWLFSQLTSQKRRSMWSESSMAAGTGRGFCRLTARHSFSEGR